MPKPGTARKLLVVEDELSYLELIVLKCEKIGFDVISARTVDEAQYLLKELATVELKPVTVDAIWLDHFLPDKNGNDFLTAVRQDSAWKDIPVFLVTNAIETDIVNWYLRNGAVQYYAKVTTPIETVIAAIDLYLQQHPTPPLATPAAT